MGLYESSPRADRAKALFRYIQYAPIHKMLDGAIPGSMIPPANIYGTAYPLRLPRNGDRIQWVPPGLLTQICLNHRSCQEIEETVYERFPCPDGFDVFYYVPKMADMWVEAIQNSSIVPSVVRGYITLQSSLYAALIQRCKQSNTIMHHYAFVVHVRSSAMTNMNGWYVHGRRTTGWNLAKPRYNTGNNTGLHLESVPLRGMESVTNNFVCPVLLPELFLGFAGFHPVVIRSCIYRTWML